MTTKDMATRTGGAIDFTMMYVTGLAVTMQPAAPGRR
jgi:hypothetical protein